VQSRGPTLGSLANTLQTSNTRPSPPLNTQRAPVPRWTPRPAPARCASSGAPARTCSGRGGREGGEQRWCGTQVSPHQTTALRSAHPGGGTSTFSTYTCVCGREACGSQQQRSVCEWVTRTRWSASVLGRHPAPLPVCRPPSTLQVQQAESRCLLLPAVPQRRRQGRLRQRWG
jgi:hypothetical protein